MKKTAIKTPTTTRPLLHPRPEMTPTRPIDEVVVTLTAASTSAESSSSDVLKCPFYATSATSTAASAGGGGYHGGNEFGPLMNFVAEAVLRKDAEKRLKRAELDRVDLASGKRGSVGGSGVGAFGGGKYANCCA